MKIFSSSLLDIGTFIVCNRATVEIGFFLFLVRRIWTKRSLEFTLLILSEKPG